jgi:hypothetical protein
MRVSWSGHKDYYTYPGATKESVDTLLAADLRLTYSFDKFDGKGEMIHTSGVDGKSPIPIIWNIHRHTALLQHKTTLLP